MATRLFLKNQHHARTFPLTALRSNRFGSILHVSSYSLVDGLCISLADQSGSTTQTIAHDLCYLCSLFYVVSMLPE